MLFIVGIPGVGKSLMLQQAALLAERRSRPVTLLRWDVARIAFEESAHCAAYAEVDQVTHAGIRLAVGHWLRPAIARWYADKGRKDLLIAECPLVGHRFIEVAKPLQDEIEPLLCGRSTSFLIPTPTLDVRTKIEALREEELRRPRHAQEQYNAPPELLRQFVDEVRDLARQLQLRVDEGSKGYLPEVYLAVYEHLLQHRHISPLIIDELLPTRASAQTLPDSCAELVPSEQQVLTSINQIETLSHEEMNHRAANWWKA